jgi:ribosomal protein S18 acetylase RimI-like enzyme
VADIRIVERDLTSAELARENAAFDEHALEHGNAVEAAERHGFVLLDGETFIGCSSGLAYREVDGAAYNRWFYLTDLFVENAYRRQGFGAQLLQRLEARVAGLGIQIIWTWTAGYEAPGFYRRQGYSVFAEQEGFYRSGHSRLAMRKSLLG